MVIALLFELAALALQVRLAAEPPMLQEGQTGTVRLIIVAGSRGDPQFDGNRAPELPVGPGLRGQFVGQSRQFQNVNGRITQILEFDYRLTALEAGSWEVGPVSLPLSDGSSASAKAITVAVGERKVIPGVLPDFEAEAKFLARDGKVYEGEIVVLHASYRSRFTGSQASFSLPTFDGLAQPGHGQPQESSYSIDDPTGTIIVQDLYVPLLAVATGKRDQGVVLASIQIPVGGPDLFGFRRTRHEQIASRRLSLDIRPLPPPPPGFSGLIGDFEIRSEIGADKAAVGQSIPWSIALSGDGNLDGFSLAEPKIEKASFYDNGSDVTARVDGERYRATASFRRVIVPTEPGELVLPEIPLVVFSPSRGQYVTIPIPGGKISVVEGKEGNSQLESYATATASGEEPVTIDLRPVYTSGRSSVPSSRALLGPLLAASALPGLAVYALTLLSAALSTIRSARERRRTQSLSPPSARSALRNLPSDPADRLVALDVALRRVEGRAHDPERLRALRMRLGKLRFGDGTPDPTLEDDIRRFVFEAEPEETKR